ncbi:MAG TPA: hypothetical protein IAC02_10360 [Candidatus Coprovivens excrementavium]|nr:hypothetical protein [Candidatus Coprovivens excrementavium]
MLEEYTNSYKELSLKDKRNILIKEIAETLLVIETLCEKKNINFDKLKSSEYIKNKDLLFEEDYYDLMFLYIVYLKEDLGLLL